MISNMTEKEINLKTEKLIAPFPNTYTFTKALSEHFLLNEKENVPLCIVRPSVVGCSYQYPIPGWVDSMIAANGLLLMVGIGALHAMLGNPDGISDFIPVDTVAYLIMASAWRTAKQYGKLQSKQLVPIPSLPIYHATTSTKNPSLWSWPLYITSGYFQRHPAKKRFGTSWTLAISNKKLHKLFFMFIHKFPAYMADSFRLVQRKKPFYLKSSNRISKAIEQLSYFTHHQWFFSNDNLDHLMEEMNPEDHRLFPIDVRKIDWEVYFITYAQGLRQYLLKETDQLNQDEILPQIRSKL